LLLFLEIAKESENNIFGQKYFLGGTQQGPFSEGFKNIWGKNIFFGQNILKKYF
jgi:hypothetical protein